MSGEQVRLLVLPDEQHGGANLFEIRRGAFQLVCDVRGNPLHFPDLMAARRLASGLYASWKLDTLMTATARIGSL